MNQYSSFDDNHKAYKLVLDFYNTVTHKNRYFSKHQLLDKLSQIAEKSTLILPSKTVLYRARIYDDYETLNKMYIINHDIERGTGTGRKVLKDYDNTLGDYKIRESSGFWGFNAEDSFVPPNNITAEGRNNPVFINYLYTAEEEYTAMVEIKPILESLVSIAEISIEKELKIADFAQNFEEVHSFDDALKENIAYCLSWIVDVNKKYYIPAQIISEYIKSIGFDGIRYSSSLYKNGHNVTIFNYENCKPICSKIHTVRGIYIKSNCTLPYDGTRVVHPIFNEKLVI